MGKDNKRKREDTESSEGSLSESPNNDKPAAYSSHDLPWVRILQEFQPSASSSSSSSGNTAVLSMEYKKALRADLDLNDNLSDDQLEEDNWVLHLLAASHARLRELATRMCLDTTGNKRAILDRLVDWYRSSHEELERSGGRIEI